MCAFIVQICKPEIFSSYTQFLNYREHDYLYSEEPKGHKYTL